MTLHPSQMQVEHICFSLSNYRTELACKAWCPFTTHYLAQCTWNALSLLLIWPIKTESSTHSLQSNSCCDVYPYYSKVHLDSRKLVSHLNLLSYSSKICSHYCITLCCTLQTWKKLLILNKKTSLTFHVLCLLWL